MSNNKVETEVVTSAQDQHEEEAKSSAIDDSEELYNFKSWKCELDDISIEIEQSFIAVNVGEKIPEEMEEPLIALDESSEEEDLNKTERYTNEKFTNAHRQLDHGFDAREQGQAEGGLFTYLRSNKVAVVEPGSEKEDEKK